jgi:hypothetical protein
MEWNQFSIEERSLGKGLKNQSDTFKFDVMGAQEWIYGFYWVFANPCEWTYTCKQWRFATTQCSIPTTMMYLPPYSSSKLWVKHENK